MTVIRRDATEPQRLEGRRSGDPLTDLASESSVRIVDLDPGASRTAHRHPHSEEVVVVASGTGAVWIDGTFTPVSAGDVVHIPPGTPHATLAAEPMRLHCFFPHPDLAANMETTDIVITEQK